MNFEKLHISTAPSAPTITTAPNVATPAARLLGAEPGLSTLPNLATNASPATGHVGEVTLVGATEPADRRKRRLGLGQFLAERDPESQSAPRRRFRWPRHGACSAKRRKPKRSINNMP
ncbi:MAG: hypothetical protein QM775_24160 [Pirellulales bacterium]